MRRLNEFKIAIIIEIKSDFLLFAISYKIFTMFLDGYLIGRIELSMLEIEDFDDITSSCPNALYFNVFNAFIGLGKGKG